MLMSLALMMTGVATPAGGQMACVLYDKTRDKVLLSRPFAAESGTESARYDAFLAAVHAEGYLPASSETEGACTWASSADAASSAVEAYRNRFASANQLTVPFP